MAEPLLPDIRRFELFVIGLSLTVFTFSTFATKAKNHDQTDEDILFYLEAAMEGNDPKHIAGALGDVARSKGMSDLARKAGLGRQALS